MMKSELADSIWDLLLPVSNTDRRSCGSAGHFKYAPFESGRLAALPSSERADRHGVWESENSRGFAELFGVAGPVLVFSVPEPGLDHPVGQSALLSQAHQLTLKTCKHKYLSIRSSRFLWAHMQGWVCCSVIPMSFITVCLMSTSLFLHPDPWVWGAAECARSNSAYVVQRDWCQE